MSEISEAVAERAEERTLRPSEVSEWYYRQAKQDIARAPGAWVKLLLHKALYSVNWFEAPCSEDYYLERARFLPLRLAFVTFGLLAPLAALGLAASRRREELLVIGFVAATMAMTVVYFYLGRYRLPAIPFVAVLAARGVVAAWSLRRRPLLGAGAALGVAGVAVVVHLNVIPFDPSQEYIKAGISAIRAGRMDEATGEFREASKLNPDNEQALQNLSALTERAGRLDEAAELWGRLRALALRLGDADTVARAERALARLQAARPMP
jgi:tetratricopeptide (TPR) repeat protein